MTDAQLIAATGDQAGVGDDEARAGLTATLEALGERLAGGAVDELAASLPPEAAAALRRGRTAEAQTGSLTDLAARVGAATGTDATQAANLVQGALRAVAGAIDADLRERLRTGLPSDLARMLQQTDEGDTSALQTGA